MLYNNQHHSDMASNPQIPSPNRTLDLILSTTLTALSLSGTVTNSVSCIYFVSTRNKAKNSNSRYFKILYTAISIVDILTCVLQIPVIHNLYLARHSSEHMFQDQAFRYVWSCAWKGIITTSVMLVAQLSGSRLAILARPLTKLSSALFWLPVTTFFVITALVIVPYLTNHVIVHFLPGRSSIPGFYGVVKGADLLKLIRSNDPIPPEMIRNDKLNNILWSCIAGGPIIPIFLLCVVSVWYLRSAAQRAKSQKAQHRQHTHASTTIVCVTILYIVCNVPSLIYLANRVFRAGHLGESHTLRQVAEILNPTKFEKFYFTLLMKSCSVLNSSLNPLLYFWRMTSFRNFLKHAVGMKESGISTSAVTSFNSVRGACLEADKAASKSDTGELDSEVYGNKSTGV